METELDHPDLPRTIPFRVFVPPCASEAQGRLPALYLLHGLARTHAHWDDLGADELAQELIATGTAPPFLIVMPWERKGLEYESAIIEFLVPHIEATYGASQETALRSVGGISRGAGWALRLGLKHPDLFDAVGLHSPAVLVPDMFDIPDWVEELPQGEFPELWIDIGHRDTLRFEAKEIADLFTELGVSFVRHTYLGEHTDEYWSDHLEDYLTWYISGWEVGTSEG